MRSDPAGVHGLDGEERHAVRDKADVARGSRAKGRLHEVD